MTVHFLREVTFVTFKAAVEHQQEHLGQGDGGGHGWASDTDRLLVTVRVVWCGCER